MMGNRFHSNQGRTRQRGVVLFISLVALIMMSIAGIALMRSVDVGTAVVGNLALREAALVAGDRGIEAGYSWLRANSTTLDTGNNSEGYYEVMPSTLTDQQLFTSTTLWANAPVARAPGLATDVDTLGYTVKFLIYRQSSVSGGISVSTGQVSKSPAIAAGSAVCAEGQDCTSGSSNRASLGGTSAYYTIYSQITGPRHTSAVVSAVVAMPT